MLLKKAPRGIWPVFDRFWVSRSEKAMRGTEREASAPSNPCSVVSQLCDGVAKWVERLAWKSVYLRRGGNFSQETMEGLCKRMLSSVVSLGCQALAIFLENGACVS